MEPSSSTKMRALLNVGQSVWLDYLHRRLIRSGELQALINHGLRGMTSNPTIFEQAIGESADYNNEIADLASSGKTDREIFETLATQDVREAADLFRPVYRATGGTDGFVSIEVSPDVAHDTDGSVSEARRLWKTVDRPNVMIKIPGTREGWPAIERCLIEGMNINITLLFSVQHYQEVSEAYMRALEARVGLGQPIDRISSVASFFVSRVDTEVDKRLQAKGGSLLSLRGKVAIAGARLAYAMFMQTMRSTRWRALEAKGAQRQRLLWASVGTKNPEYSDVMYVESLIGPDTVTTIPPDTLTQFDDHGKVADALGIATEAELRRVMETLAAGGIHFADINHTLEAEGIDKFAKSFEKLLGAIAKRRREMASTTATVVGARHSPQRRNS